MQSKNAMHQITEGVIWKQLLIFFFPILLGTFFQQMYNTVDTIIVGRYVGTTALAAVGSTGPLISLINGFFIGMSSGVTVILSQFYGANDHGGIERGIHTGIPHRHCPVPDSGCSGYGDRHFRRPPYSQTHRHARELP